MLENVVKFLKKILKTEQKNDNSKSAAKERLHLVLIQDRASVSADFLEVMKQEIIDVIKKYIDIDENAIDVRLTNNTKEDGTTGAPALYANFPITNVKPKVSIPPKSSEIKEDEFKENKEEEENKNNVSIENIQEQAQQIIKQEQNDKDLRDKKEEQEQNEEKDKNKNIEENTVKNIEE